MNHLPKISIVTPTYNAEKDIESCILSVAGQAYQNKEHLIIDGLSTDKTLDIVIKYADKYPHIRYISEKDDGIYDAMNKGIDLAEGEWIYFLGADDVVYNDTVFQDIFSVDGISQYDVVYGNVLWGDTGTLYDGKFSLLKLIDRNICHQAIFYRLSTINKFGKFNIKYKLWADWLLNIQCFSSKETRVNYIDTIVAKYSFGGYSHQIVNDEDFLEAKDAIYKDYFPEEYIHFKENILDNLKKQIEQKNCQLADFERHIAQMQQNLALMQQHIDNLELKIKALLTSLSWRITSPLRSLADIAGRGNQCWQSLLKIVNRNGGIKSIALSLLSVYRQEGFAGIACSAKQFLLRLRSMTTGADTASSSIDFDPQTGYFLTDTPVEYTYIPPRRPADFDQLREGMVNKPVFSILVPVYNTSPELLGKMIDSVIAQWYSDWQLILADDASTSESTKAFLADLNDPKIIVLHGETNKGISGATNAALSHATGDYVVLLDHDDELTEDCLFELALCVNRNDPDYIYSDEDKITPEGRFAEPHYKPDWSPDTMMSTMYVCHVSCVRRSKLLEIGGFRSEFDGCQDWDMVLRLTEKTDRISHIPKVLYHWRILSGSIAGDIAAKSYILSASKRLREDALKRRGLKGSIEAVEQVKGYFRVNYHIVNNPLISIIITTRDNGTVLRRCIDSITAKSTYRNFEIIIIDNGSVQTETLEYLAQIDRQSKTTVIRHDKPFNYSALNNIGVNNSRGDLLLFLNDDTEIITNDWLERLGGYAQLLHVGAVGAKLLYPSDHRVQHAGIVNLQDGPVHAFQNQSMNVPGYYMRNLLECNWLAVTGACLMVERKKFQMVGGFDESLPIAYNNVALCMSLHEAGLYNVVCQAVRLLHYESLSRGEDLVDPRKRERLKSERRYLFDKYPHFFQFDPFYNTNLVTNRKMF